MRGRTLARDANRGGGEQAKLPEQGETVHHVPPFGVVAVLEPDHVPVGNPDRAASGTTGGAVGGNRGGRCSPKLVPVIQERVATLPASPGAGACSPNPIPTATTDPGPA